MIKELIERVKLTPQEIQLAKIPILEKYAHLPLRDMKLEGVFQCEIQEAVAEAQLNRVLNDPDLYVLNGKILDAELGIVKEPESGQDYGSYAGGWTDCWLKSERLGFKSVTPLRDAIKEVQDD